MFTPEQAPPTPKYNRLRKAGLTALLGGVALYSLISPDSTETPVKNSAGASPEKISRVKNSPRLAAQQKVSFDMDNHGARPRIRFKAKIATASVSVSSANETDQSENPDHNEQASQPKHKPKYPPALEEWLYELRQCESGGDYQIDTGNGYYGAYQFSEATWQSLDTGYAEASDAPPAVQDAAIIENTNRSDGGLATQNPGCYEAEGLSQFPPK